MSMDYANINVDNLKKYLKQHNTDIVKNYKELCRILGVKVATSSRSRKKQKDLFSTLFEWEVVEGTQKIRIIKIYDVEDRPISVLSKQGAYRKNLCILLLYKLKIYGRYGGTYNSLTYDLGYKKSIFKDFCNLYSSLNKTSDLYSANKVSFKDSDLQEEIKDTVFYEAVVNDFISKTTDNSKKTVQSAVEDLLNEGIISKKPAFRLFYKRYNAKTNKFEQLPVFICAGKAFRKYSSINECIEQNLMCDEEDLDFSEEIIIENDQFFNKIERIEDESIIEVQKIYTEKNKNSNAVFNTISDVYKYNMFETYKKIFSKKLVKNRLPKYVYRAFVLEPIKNIVNDITYEEYRKAKMNINSHFCEALINKAEQRYNEKAVDMRLVEDAIYCCVLDLQYMLSNLKIEIVNCYPKESLKQYKILVENLLRMNDDAVVAYQSEDDCFNDELIA